MATGKVTLVIFSSEGRDHLLSACYPSFSANNDYHFFQTILAIDGQYDPRLIQLIKPDVILQQFERKGYINNIQSALSLVRTPYFFWLEDDFIFNQAVPVKRMLEIAADSSWAGTFLSRTAPLEQADRQKSYAVDLFVPHYGFSVSPSLCNTGHVKDAFKNLAESPKDQTTRFLGFEPFIDDYFNRHDLKYAVVDPGNVPHVDHIGGLESTPREYHMINSIDENLSDINKVYLSGFGKEKKIGFYNRLTMLPKLWYSTFILSIRLLKNRRAYDFAFRIYISFLRGFKY